MNVPVAVPRVGQRSSGRYARSGCGSIIDSGTGLEWIVGPDTQIDWPEAADWVQKLRACGKSWSMPSSEELRSLFDKQYSAGKGYLTRGRRWPAHIQPIFSGIGGGSWVWADRKSSSGKAAAVNFNQGIDVTIPQHGFDGTVRVFAVNRDNGNAANVVRRFYQALALGDGDQASRLLVPEKRKGALAPEAISAYYSRLLEPLALTSLQSRGSDDFLVRYRFRSDKLRCDGSAVVTTITRGGRRVDCTH